MEELEQVWEAILQKMAAAKLKTTEDRDTYADGYYSGLIEALGMVKDAIVKIESGQ